MFNVEQLKLNQQNHLKSFLKEDDNYYKERQFDIKGNINFFDNLIDKIFLNFPLRNNENLFLETMTGPMYAIKPWPPEEDYNTRMFNFFKYGTDRLEIISRPYKLRPRFLNDNYPFIEEYTNNLVKIIEDDLQRIAPARYVFAMWVPFYHIDKSSKHIMTHFGKRVVGK